MTATFGQCQSCQTLNKINPAKALESAPVCGKCGSSLAMHGLVAEVNTDNFQKILSMAEGPVIVDFWATWCGPCRMYGPEYEKASKENQQAIFLKVSTETEQALAAQFGIRGIPCTIVIKNGKEVARQAGAMSAAQVGQFIKPHI